MENSELTQPLAVFYGASAAGRSVAEAEVGDIAAARELLSAAAAAGCELAWAHSPADLSGAGFSPRPGYRRLTGPGRPAAWPDEVRELSGPEDTAQLCAAAYSGQWGHKTPDAWPVAELTGSRLLGLRRDGLTVGVCRVTQETGLIDAPGLLAGQPDDSGYRDLLAAGLSLITTGQATVESWGDGPDRVRVCEQLGLVTAEYCPGWEFELLSRPGPSGRG